MIWLLACNSTTEPIDTGPTVVVAEPRVGEHLDTLALARRMSLDLRGVVLSADEVQRLRGDETQLEVLRDEMLEDARFEERVVDMLGERWHTRVDQFNIHFWDFGLPFDDQFRFERDLGEEPLRLLAAIVAEDRSWSEITTADHTMATPLLAELFDLDRESGDGWTRATYQDGRPAAGVLTTNGYLQRYYTTIFNMNRTRAAATARLTVCEDFLTRPVSFTGAPSLTDDDATATAIKEEPGCAGCHSAIEPMAAAFFGFYVADTNAAIDTLVWHPEREPMAEELLGTRPAWFGQPVDGLDGLGQAIARDPGLSRCAAEGFSEALWRRAIQPDDFGDIERARRVLVESDLRIKPMLAAITDADTYRLAPTDPERPTRHMMSPQQVASSIEDLTGFEWTWREWERMEEDSEGFRVMAGGVDGENLLRPQQQPGVSWVLVTKRYVEAAAAWEVQENQGDEGALLSNDELGDQFEELTWRLYGRAPMEGEAATFEALFDEIAAQSTDDQAWATVLSVMLRDPEFLSY